MIEPPWKVWRRILPPPIKAPFNDVGGDVSCFLLSTYIFTSRIASQTKAAVIYKEHSIPLLICPVLNFCNHIKQRLWWVSVNGTRRTSCHTNKTSIQPSGHCETGCKASSSLLMCFEVYHSACRLPLLACKTRYWSSITMVYRGKPILKVSYSCCSHLKWSPRSWHNAVSDPKLLGHTSHTSTFF